MSSNPCLKTYKKISLAKAEPSIGAACLSVQKNLMRVNTWLSCYIIICEENKVGVYIDILIILPASSPGRGQRFSHQESVREGSGYLSVRVVGTCQGG